MNNVHFAKWKVLKRVYVFIYRHSIVFHCDVKLFALPIKDETCNLFFKSGITHMFSFLSCLTHLLCSLFWNIHAQVTTQRYMKMQKKLNLTDFLNFAQHCKISFSSFIRTYMYFNMICITTENCIFKNPHRASHDQMENSICDYVKLCRWEFRWMLNVYYGAWISWERNIFPNLSLSFPLFEQSKVWLTFHT